MYSLECKLLAFYVGITQKTLIAIPFSSFFWCRKGEVWQFWCCYYCVFLYYYTYYTIYIIVYNNKGIGVVERG